METPDPPSDTPGASKQVVLTPHDIPRSLREICFFLLECLIHKTHEKQHELKQNDFNSPSDLSIRTVPHSRDYVEGFAEFLLSGLQYTQIISQLLSKYPIGPIGLVYLSTFTMNINQMLVCQSHGSYRYSNSS